MLFHFTFTPLRAVALWGEEGRRKLHWFGLTDGQYWIQAGEATLLEYNEMFRVGAKAGGGADGDGNGEASRYCDYYVARLHEDLLEMAPAILEAVPEDLAAYLAGAKADEWERCCAAWFERANEAEGERDDSMDWQARAAIEWISRRELDVMYLAGKGLRIRLWSEGTEVRLAWDHARDVRDGLPVWTAQVGECRMPREVFVAELRSFHERLMEAMAGRIAEVRKGVLGPELEIDLDRLVAEQKERYDGLARALEKPLVATDWDEVRRAMGFLEQSWLGGGAVA